MTFNEFQRELQKRGIDGHNAYMFTLVYERLGHVMKEVEDMAKGMVAMANSMKGFVDLHEATQGKVTALAEGKWKNDDADVGSVGFSPEEFDKNKKSN